MAQSRRGSARVLSVCAGQTRGYEGSPTKTARPGTQQAPRGTHGGRLFIWNSEDLEAATPVLNRPQIVDLAEWYAIGGPNNPTGAKVVRPHMTYPSPDGKYMALAFVASGHVALIDAEK